ncbi:hypothetical protein [Streptomyces shenzhenensis]|nr:hypothetical protein [Streptomyces shenzhenensis]
MALERSGPERFLSTLPLLTAPVGQLRRTACTPGQQVRVGGSSPAGP